MLKIHPWVSPLELKIWRPFPFNIEVTSRNHDNGYTITLRRPLYLLWQIPACIISNLLSTTISCQYWLKFSFLNICPLLLLFHRLLGCTQLISINSAVSFVFDILTVFMCCVANLPTCHFTFFNSNMAKI